MAETTRDPEVQAIYDELAADARAALTKSLTERGQDFTEEQVEGMVAFITQTFQEAQAMHLDFLDELVAKFRTMATDPRFAAQAPGLSLAAKILAESVEGER